MEGYGIMSKNTDKRDDPIRVREEDLNFLPTSVRESRQLVLYRANIQHTGLDLKDSGIIDIGDVL